MQQVSELYKKEMQKQLRGMAYTRIDFGLVDEDAADDMQTETNGHMFFSEPGKISRFVQEASYATAENKSFCLNGRQKVVPDTAENILYQGLLIFGADAGTIEKISGSITVMGAVVAYILAETKVDAASAGNEKKEE